MIEENILEVPNTPFMQSKEAHIPNKLVKIDSQIDM